ncbi:hypothetical protein B0H13DRAFT_2648148 [Mycena leptocephala]|nr:hypothetical protein B0H13DRAFT_2648148 [Mycena leptocephala]
MSQNVTYDDRDPILNYSPGWFRTGTYNASSIGETGTLASSSITTGVNVTFVFPIPATEFYYFGMKRSHGGSYLICIDCDPNDRQFETINAVDITDDGKNPPVVLFSRKFPEPGVHEVILMNQPDINFGGNSQITLDKFQLLVPEAVQTVLSNSPAPTISTSATNLDQTGSSSSHNSILVPVLAGVLGGLAILLILLGIWLLLRRKSRRPVRSEEQPSDYQSESSENLWPSSTSRFTARVHWFHCFDLRAHVHDYFASGTGRWSDRQLPVPR